MKSRARELYAAATVRELERRAVAQGVPGYVLMQRAGAAAWAAITETWHRASHIAVICGSGNNGGDGYVIAALAQAAGCAVRVFALGTPPPGSDGARACADWQARGEIEPWTAASIPKLAEADVIVDAIFGIGLSRPVEGEARAAIEAINGEAGRAAIVAIDVPSGLQADSGAVLGTAVKADLTVTFLAHKGGLYTGQGPARAGRVWMDALGCDAAAPPSPPIAHLLDASELRHWLPRRSRSAHKGAHGHVLVVGGNRGTAGAVLLAARAALRSGAGLVSVATRAEHAGALAAAQPELMTRGVEDAAELREMLSRASVVAIGPGLGQDAWAQQLFAAVMDSDRPLVVDADALNLLATDPQARGRWLLTPHPGEAARLLGCTTAQIEQDRFAAARELHRRFDAVVVLKGAGTLVQGESTAVCPYGNPGMAVGGMGDALTGVAAALLAQKLPMEPAAQAAVLAHARAGDAAAEEQGERGLLPTDLIAHLRRTLNP